MEQKPKIQLTESQREEAKTILLQAMRRAKLTAAREEAKKLPLEEQRAYMQNAARNL